MFRLTVMEDGVRKSAGFRWVGLGLLVASGCSGASTGSGEPLDADEAETADTLSDFGTTDVPGFEVEIDTGTPKVDAKPETTADSAAEADATLDSGPIDSTPADTTPADTGPDDTGPADTGPADTGPADTGPADTGPADTGPADTGPADTGPADTGPADTGPADTGPADTGATDSGPTDTGVDAPDTALGPPTVKVTVPALNTKIPYDKTSDACQSRIFTVTYTAPAGFRSMKWLWVTPNKASATTAMLGTCDGLPAYGYFMDPTKYGGSTGGTFSEDVAIAGLYSGSAGSGRWWWCTEPTKTTAGGILTSGVSMKDVTFSAPPAPSPSGAVQTLSNYCYAKSTPPDTDLGSRWQLQVTIVDTVGATATDTLFFWVHQ